MSIATDIANDLAVIRQKFQNSTAFDPITRQIMTRIVETNENEGLFEKWSTEVEPKVREMGEALEAAEKTIKEQSTTIAEKDAEIARLTALVEQPPTTLELVPEHVASEYPDAAISGRDDITGHKRPPLRDINSA